MALLIKALLGAVVVLVIQLLAQTKNYYIAGLVPLFPTFALVSHYIIGTERTTDELRKTLRFGMLSMIPYFIYMITLYVLVTRVPLIWALLGAILAWSLGAVLLLVIFA